MPSSTEKASQFTDFDLSLIAGVDLPRYSVGKIDANGEVILADSATDPTAGITQNQVSAGEVVALRSVHGEVSRCLVADASVTKGDQIECDGAGKIIQLAAGRPIGWALETGGAADEIVTIIYDPDSIT